MYRLIVVSIHKERVKDELNPTAVGQLKVTVNYLSNVLSWRWLFCNNIVLFFPSIANNNCNCGR